jgi:glucuronoarabinoxylan endo-1,4-beta-xylanase
MFPEKDLMKRFVLIACSLSCFLSFGQTISIDHTTEHQTMIGFGAFGAKKPYWEGAPLYDDAFVNLFLNDLGATIVRTNIFWDFEPVNDNASASVTDLSKFNYKAGSDIAKQIPYYKALKAAGLKKLIATSWTPPVWMKLHDEADRIPDQCYNCNNCPMSDPARKVCGGRLDPKYYNEYAEYLAAYVKVIKQETGIELYGLSLQNEPYFANPFEANVVRPAEYADILKAVGERFRKDGLTTRLFGPEHMAEWSWGVQQQYVNESLGDATVKPYLDIYAVHGYVDGVAPDFGSAEGWTALHDNITVAHDKPLWMTETSGYEVTFTGAMNLAKSMYLALRFGNISSWVYWSISGAADGYSLMVNGQPSIVYYASKQYFKFIRPGAIRIKAESDDAEVLPLAFKNPTNGDMTIILINTGSSEKSFTLDSPIRPAEFTVYRTTATENCAQIGTVSSGTVSLPPMSISTLVGSGDSGPSIDDIGNRYIKAGDPEIIEIPLTGISNGNGGTLTITAESSDEAIITNTEVIYSSPSETGTLKLTANNSTPGKATITLNLQNQNTIDADEFGFNSTSTSFSVEVLNVVTGLKKNESETPLKISPNPTNTGSFRVELEAAPVRRQVSVFNLQGQEITALPIERGQRQITIQSQNWEPGLYYLHVSGHRPQHGKVITIR